jgi:hypothetical protein
MIHRAQGGGFEGRAPGPADAAPLLSCCFWCMRPHHAPHPLSVCPACVAALRARSFPMARLEMKARIH